MNGIIGVGSIIDAHIVEVLEIYAAFVKDMFHLFN
jgi:hypothetical protein